MPLVGPGVKPCRDLPQLYGLVSGATYEKIAVHYEIDVADVMIVPVECLAAQVVVSEVP